MTKEEAIQAMFKGEKVTHMYFTPDEFIMIASDGSGRYETEEGYIINPALFWIDRRASYWQNGWDIYTGNLTATII